MSHTIHSAGHAWLHTLCHSHYVTDVWHMSIHPLVHPHWNMVVHGALHVDARLLHVFPRYSSISQEFGLMTGADQCTSDWYMSNQCVSNSFQTVLFMQFIEHLLVHSNPSFTGHGSSSCEGGFHFVHLVVKCATNS